MSAPNTMYVSPDDEIRRMKARHAALIAKVREIAQNMPHDAKCDSNYGGYMDTDSLECSCPRGKLLEVINGRD